MSNRKMTMAVVSIATIGIAVVAPAMAITSAPSPTQMIVPAADGMQHAIVSECYWKKVCAKWGGGHICKEWTQKKVCGSPIGGSKAPPSTPPRIKKRL